MLPVPFSFFVCAVFDLIYFEIHYHYTCSHCNQDQLHSRTNPPTSFLQPSHTGPVSLKRIIPHWFLSLVLPYLSSPAASLPLSLLLSHYWFPVCLWLVGGSRRRLGAVSSQLEGWPKSAGRESDAVSLRVFLGWELVMVSRGENQSPWWQYSWRSVNMDIGMLMYSGNNIFLMGFTYTS